MTKRPRSLHGELQPHPVKAKIGDHNMSSQIDDQTVFSQLDMPLPGNALVEDTTIDDTTLDKRVKQILHDEIRDRRDLLQYTTEEYRVNHTKCSRAVRALASVLLPAIFEEQHTEDCQASLVASYEDTMKHNPWLVKMLIDACTKEMYGNIRRIGLCSS
jgi:hypothetical protein